MNRTPHRWLDAAAMGASTVCLLHCLALPLLIAALPAFAGIMDVDEEMHRALFAFALPTSLLALAAGHRRHRSLSPPLGGAAGLVLLACGLLVESAGLEVAVSTVGSLLLASAHLANWRRRAPAA